VHYKNDFGRNNVFANNHADLSELDSDANYGFYIHTTNDLRGNIICSNNTVTGKSLANVITQMHSACSDALTATPTSTETIQPTPQIPATSVLQTTSPRPSAPTNTPTLQTTSPSTATSTPTLTLTPTSTPTPTLLPQASATPLNTPIPNPPSVYLVLIANQN